MPAPAPSLPAALILQVDLPPWAEWVVGVSVVIIAVALVIAAVALAWVALQLPRLIRPISALVGRLQEESKPALHHVRNVAENVDYMSTAIRQDVDRLKLALSATQERLERASAETDRRIREFNAFIGVVQEEAEDLFIDTASTLRGVRAGADTLQSRRGRPGAPDVGPSEVRVVPRPE